MFEHRRLSTRSRGAERGKRGLSLSAALLLGFLTGSGVVADAKSLRIAFGSCIASPEAAGWTAIQKADPQAVVLLGDNVYLDSRDFGKLDRIRAHYARLGETPGFKALRSLIPVYGIWDDHDFGPNNSDSMYEHRPDSDTVFREFWKPVAVPKLEDTMAQQVQLPGVELLLTDGRSDRVSPRRHGDPRLFGEKQLVWLEQRIRETSEPYIVVASGTQILCHTDRDECLADYPKERKRLLDAAAGSRARVVFLSGDRHYSEILTTIHDGKKLIEGSVSPMAAPFRTPEKVGIEPARKALVTQENVFGLLTLSGDSQRSVTIEIYRSDGELLVRMPGI